MEKKKKEIRELRHKSIRKRKRKELALITFFCIIAILSGVYIFEAPELNILNEQEPNYAQEITISESIKPYTTSLNRNETVKITNKRNEKAELTFETIQLQENISLEPNTSTYINFDDYNNLPSTNYYRVNAKSSGQIVFQ